MRLAQHLESLPPERLLWLSEEAGPYRVSDERAARREHGGMLARCAAARPALCFRSSVRYAQWLLWLDGVCDQMLLLPPGTDAPTLTKLCADAAADLLLTDLDLELGLERLDWRARDGEPRGVLTSRDTGWLIPTSGTTGTPKLIPHTARTLTRTVKARADAAAAPLCWGLLYGVSRFAGLQVWLQSLAGGGRLLLPAEPADAVRSLAFLAGEGCTALSATPTLWRKLLMAPARDELRLRQITLGGEIVDQPILDALRARFPGARLTHIYASTEAGVGFSVHDGRAGFPRAWLESGAGQVDLRMRDGFLWLRIPDRFTALQLPPSLEIDADGFLNSGDLVSLAGDRVCFLGRANGAINVGGNKVHPEEVEAVLLAYPGVRLASVRGQRNPFTGFLVVAEVVADVSADERTAWIRALTEHCRQRLPAFKVPAKIACVADLAVNPTGKVGRS